MTDKGGRRYREDARVPTKSWNGWVRAMVPDKKKYSKRTRYYTKRTDEHVGFYCNNIREAFKGVDCGIYEWKAVYKPRRKSRHYVVYIGQTHRESKTDLKDRIEEYCRNGSHISEEINKVLEQGYELYVRVKNLRKASKKKVAKAEKEMLDAWNYAWNTQQNEPSRDDVPP